MKKTNYINLTLALDHNIYLNGNCHLREQFDGRINTMEIINDEMFRQYLEFYQHSYTNDG